MSNAGPAIERPLQRLFAELGIEAETLRHAPVHTVAQSQTLRGALPGGHVKNLFLRDKKRNKWLVTVEEMREVDLKRLRRVLSASGNLSFGSADLLAATLGVAPGAVTPFAVMNDAAGEVTFVLDAGLLRHEMLNAHPLHNEATVTVARDDLLRFADHCGHPPLIVEFDGDDYRAVAR